MADILLMPRYLTKTSQAGLREHIRQVCRATRLGVIVYNRANFRLTPETFAAVAEDCPNLIGFKDGVGDIEAMVAVYRRNRPARVSKQSLMPAHVPGRAARHRRGQGGKYDTPCGMIPCRPHIPSPRR